MFMMGSSQGLQAVIWMSLIDQHQRKINGHRCNSIYQMFLLLLIVFMCLLKCVGEQIIDQTVWIFVDSSFALCYDDIRITAAHCDFKREVQVQKVT